MLFNQDFKEMLFALSEANAEFLLVGAYALAAHGHPRATGHLDIWVRADSENAPRVFQSLAAFGAPLDDLTIEDLSKPGVVFQIGVEPSRIDILTAISGVDFDRAWDRRVSIFGGSISWRRADYLKKPVGDLKSWDSFKIDRVLR